MSPLLYGLPIAIIDYETTGPNPQECHPVQVCVAHCELGKTEPVVVLNERIKPPIPIPEGASNVHGIYDKDVSECRTIEDVASDIDDALRGRVVVIYNSPFDATITTRLVVPLPVAGTIDVMVMAKHIDKYKKGKKLTDVAGRRGITFKAHDAAGDVMATGALVSLLIRELGAKRTATLAVHLEWQLKTAIDQERDFVAYRKRVGQESPTTPWSDSAAIIR